MTVQDDVIRAIMNKTIAGYRTYAAQLWELGKVLADMQTVGMPQNWGGTSCCCQANILQIQVCRRRQQCCPCPIGF